MSSGLHELGSIIAWWATYQAVSSTPFEKSPQKSALSGALAGSVLYATTFRFGIQSFPESLVEFKCIPPHFKLYNLGRLCVGHSVFFLVYDGLLCRIPPIGSIVKKDDKEYTVAPWMHTFSHFFAGGIAAAGYRVATLPLYKSPFPNPLLTKAGPMLMARSVFMGGTVAILGESLKTLLAF